MNMAINFKIKEDNSKPTKEEMKLHIIENLMETRFKSYNNTELTNSMYKRNGDYGRFSEIYDWICDKVFNEE